MTERKLLTREEVEWWWSCVDDDVKALVFTCRHYMDEAERLKGEKEEKKEGER